MKRIPTLLIGTILTATVSVAQCTLDLPLDTVNVFWGYAPSECSTLVPTATGVAPYNYAWSNGATSSSISVCDTASSWYFLTLTDDTGCMSTDSVFVNVVDVHCGNNNNKVLVCHIPPGNPANAHTICISANGVPAHLAHGCKLGSCNTSSTGGGNATVQLEMMLAPNPTSGPTTVTVTSRAAQHVRLTVVDALGRTSSVLMEGTMAEGESRVFPVNEGALPENTRMVWFRLQNDQGITVQRALVLER